jgi:hypothetical protein
MASLCNSLKSKKKSTPNFNLKKSLGKNDVPPIEELWNPMFYSFAHNIWKCITYWHLHWTWWRFFEWMKFEGWSIWDNWELNASSLANYSMDSMDFLKFNCMNPSSLWSYSPKLLWAHHFKGDWCNQNQKHYPWLISFFQVVSKSTSNWLSKSCFNTHFQNLVLKHVWPHLQHVKPNLYSLENIKL